MSSHHIHMNDSYGYDVMLSKCIFQVFIYIDYCRCVGYFITNINQYKIGALLGGCGFIIQAGIVMDVGFGKKIFSGSLWILLFRWISRLLGVVSIIVLARILLPEDYGLIAKAVAFSSFLQLLTEFGFSTVLVRNKNAEKDDYDTVWTLSVIRGMVLFAIIFLCADFISVFFKDERVYELVIVYGFIAMLNGFINVGIVDFHKNMNFNKEFKLNIVTRLAEFGTTLTIAIIYKSYWAFPLGNLAGMILKLAMSYSVSPYRPTMSLKSFEKIFNFSKWFFVYESITAFSTKLDVILLSKYSSTESLGLYTISREISALPSTEIAMPVARASLPALAALTDDIGKFRNLNVTILSSVVAITLPAVIGICVIADYLVMLLLGPNWSGAVVFLQILAFIGVSRVNVACAVSALSAVGRADRLGHYSLFTLATRAICMVCGLVLGGAEGLAWGVLVASVVGMIVIHWFQSTMQLISYRMLLDKIWRVIVSSFMMWAIMILMLNTLFIESLGVVGWLAIPLTLIGVVVYCSSLLLLCKFSGWPEGPEKYFLDMFRKTNG